MNMKKMILNSLLLGIGVLLRQLTPPFLLGMKPDFSLVMLFIIIFYNDDFKSCIASGFVCGIFAAMTTSFPGGQLPIFIDKLITTTIVYFTVKALKKHLVDQAVMVIVIFLGTIISGTAFLYIAKILAGLPADFSLLFVSIVLPASFINTAMGMVVFNIFKIGVKRSNYSM